MSILAVVPGLVLLFFFSSRRLHTRCALVTGFRRVLFRSDRSYWARGAELGWPSLLVGEEHGGGSISGHGLVDLTLVAHDFGPHPAPGPPTPTKSVAAALRDVGAGAWDELIGGILAGTSIATWCSAEPQPNDRLGRVTLDVRADGDDVVLNGVKRPVESAADADHLLVTGRTGDGLTQVLVPRETAGVTLSPMTTVDLTRRFSTVTFDDVRVPASSVLGEVGGAGAQVERQLQIALVLACAESVGTMQKAFDMTVEWAFDRYSFRSEEHTSEVQSLMRISYAV